MTMPTFNEFATLIVNERARFIRGAAKERNRFGLHVRTAGFAEMPLTEIRPRHILAWHVEMQTKTACDKRGARTLSKASIERCHALVSVVFGEALRRDLIPSNPCVGCKLRMPVGEGDTREKWSWFTLEEQQAIQTCAAIPDDARWAILFALGTGLRQGEQFNLELRDLHVDDAETFVFVRYGSPGLPPKSGKCRRVPLFGLGLEAARAWLTILPTFAPSNPLGLAFPSRVGARRGVGKPLGRGRRIDGKWLDPFHEHLRAAGITKRARWHDLRHGCASSLVMGHWGRAWRIEEIREMLGHSSITISQRYAHLGDDALKAAARETAAAGAPPPPPSVRDVMAKGPAQVRRYAWARGLVRRAVEAKRVTGRRIRQIVAALEATGS